MADKHIPYPDQAPEIMTADIVWCEGHQRFEVFGSAASA